MVLNLILALISVMYVTFDIEVLLYAILGGLAAKGIAALIVLPLSFVGIMKMEMNKIIQNFSASEIGVAAISNIVPMTIIWFEGYNTLFYLLVFPLVVLFVADTIKVLAKLELIEIKSDDT